MKLLPPQRLQPHYFEGVEQALRDSFAVFLFNPIIEILREATTQADVFENAFSTPNRDLLLAMRRGAVQYSGGVFSGELDGRVVTYLRSLGAELGADGYWRLSEWMAPAWIRFEAVAANRRAQVVHDKISRELDRAQERLEAGMMPIPLDPAGPISAIEEGFETAAEALGISKRIPARQRAAMEQRYAESVRPYVVEATTKYIDMVHRDVASSAAAGYRYEAIVADLQHVVGVSETKARFLARQETGLFMAGYRRERFAGAGVTRYKWSTSHDIRVRPYDDGVTDVSDKEKMEKRRKHGDHRVLDGQIYTYEHKAPEQFMSCGNPCNPGEDFQCRCVDLAIIE